MSKYIASDNKRMSGKSGLSVYMRNGVYRDYVSPVNTSTSYKQFIIDALSTYTNKWNFQLQDDMILWNKFALIQKDVFYNDNIISGKQAFISCNIMLAIEFNDNGTVHISTPFDITNYYNLTFRINSITSSLIEVENTSVSGNSITLFSASPNLSAGTFKPRQCDFRMIGVANFNTGDTIDLFSLWNTRFSTSPNTGDKIFIRSKVIYDNGTVSPVFQTSAIVT